MDKMKDWKVANIYGMPNLSVKLEDRTIEKYVPIRGSIPEDGVPEDITDYNASIFVDGDNNEIKKKLTMLLASRIADEMVLFNAVIKEIDSSLDSIRVVDLPSMLCEEGTNGYGNYISPNLKNLKSWKSYKNQNLYP